MDKPTALLISQVVAAAVREAIAKTPQLSGFVVSSPAGRFDSTTMTVKIEVREPMATIAAKAAASPRIASLTADEIHYGLAPAGTPIVFSGGRGTVIKARHTKYLFLNESTQREMLISFRACSLDTSRVSA